jgi:hypothetical protein
VHLAPLGVGVVPERAVTHPYRLGYVWITYS